MADTNPHGANGTTSDPREPICWENYLNSVMAGKENAFKAAIDAGYEESSAKNITLRGWFKERLAKLNRKDLFSKSERVLHEIIDMPIEVEKREGYGEDAEMIVKTEPALIKIKQDTAKFVVERLGKDEGYSIRSEVTGAGGKDLMPETLTAEDKANLLSLLKK